MQNKRYCSVPRAFGFGEWFEKRFHFDCQLHDFEYETEANVSKFEADMKLTKAIWNHGNKTLAVFSFLFLLTFGWLYWKKI